MSKTKKPNWDKRENNLRGSTGGGSAPFSAVDDQIKKGMTIAAKYKGKNINMKIITEISTGVFEAKIFDIEPSATTHEGLSIDDIVEIKREDIYWHQR